MACVYFNWPNRKIRVHKPECHEARDRRETNTGLWVTYDSTAIAFQIANAYGATYGFADVRGCQKCAPI